MTNEEAKNKLLELYKLDQKYRNQWHLEEMRKLQTEIDKRNMLELLDIVELIGWPSIEKVGEDASYAAILIAQHSRDIVNSLKCLDMAMALFRENSMNIDSKKLANWVDAMNLQRKMPQVYGQYMIDYGKGNEIYTIEDPQNLDVRRKSMGLGTFDDYLRQVISKHPEDKNTIHESYKKIFGVQLAL